MDAQNLTKLNLNFPIAAPLDLSKFTLLSDTESDRLTCNSYTNQINELKAQLEIVNEDRQRLKRENERLRQDKTAELSKILASQNELHKHIELEKLQVLQQEVGKLKKECEEKDKLLNAMRSLLGGNEALVVNMKENQEGIKVKVATHGTRLPGTRKALKANRSISPYTKCA
jgi:chromosome segregation ATPase